MTVALNFLATRERFIPVDLRALCRKMLDDGRLSSDEREQLHSFFEISAARFHFDFHKRLQEIKAAYMPFDPDCEDLCPTPIPFVGVGSEEQLATAFEALLRDANYVEMTSSQIRACIEYDSCKGLLIRASLADYAQLRVFYRGVRAEQRPIRSWLTPWRLGHETIHVLSRVAILVRQACSTDNTIALKLFRDVVAEDLEMLLPDVRIRMRWFDHLKIGTSLAGGIVTAVSKAFTAAMLSPWVFLAVLCSFGGALTRSVLGFFSSKTRYLQTLTTRLYFKCLASNSSLLAHVIDAAEGEECKEVFLAYFLLYVERDRNFSVEALDRRAEQWLRSEFGVDADFEIDDAVRKLAEKRLLERLLVGGDDDGPAQIVKVYDLPSALRRLDETWDEFFAYHRPASDADRLADGDRPREAEPNNADQLKAA